MKFAISQKRLIAAATALATVFLFCAIFWHQLSEFHRVIQKNIKAGSVSWSFGGLIRVDRPQFVHSAPSRPAASSVTIYFSPLRNFLSLASCELSVECGSDSAGRLLSTEAGRFVGEIVRSLSLEGLSGDVKVDLRYARRSGDECEIANYYGFETGSEGVSLLSAALRGTYASSAFTISGSDSSFLFSGGTCGVELSSSGDGIYEFAASSLPVGLISKGRISEFLDAPTGEVSLRLKQRGTDLTGAAVNHLSLSGSAKDVHIVHKIFGGVIKVGFRFRLEGGRIIFSDLNESGAGSSRISGTLNPLTGDVSAEILASDFDLSCFSAAFLRARGIIAHYTPSGLARVFLKIDGKLARPEIYGEIALTSGMLQGDAGYKNISNIAGSINFSNDRINFTDLSGRLLSSKVDISGGIGISANGSILPDFTLDFVDMPVAELRECMIFGDNEIGRLLENVQEGKVTIALKAAVRAGAVQLTGSGSFVKCRASLPLGGDRLQISDIGGSMSITDESIGFSDSYGFAGNVPFFFSGAFSRSTLKKYSFTVKFNNVDFSDVSSGAASGSYLSILSRVQSRGRSRLELRLSSAGQDEMACSLGVSMHYPEISLLPLPFSLTIETVSGGLAFDYVPGSSKTSPQTPGTFRVRDLDIKMKGAAKIIILSSLTRSIPVSISGNVEGAVGMPSNSSADAPITGNLSFSSGSMRYFDNKYVELLVRLSDFSSSFTIANSIFSGSCRFSLLDGNARADFRTVFSGPALSSSVTLAADGLRLSKFYDENPGITRYADGLMSLSMKSSFSGSEGAESPVTGKVEIKNGQLSNLSRLEAVSRTEIVPNTIYQFNRLAFDFSAAKGSLRLSAPVYDGAEKAGFLGLLSDIASEIKF